MTFLDSYNIWSAFVRTSTGPQNVQFVRSSNNAVRHRTCEQSQSILETLVVLDPNSDDDLPRVILQ